MVEDMSFEVSWRWLELRRVMNKGERHDDTAKEILEAVTREVSYRLVRGEKRECGPRVLGSRPRSCHVVSWGFLLNVLPLILKIPEKDSLDLV